jgi:Laminin G domain
MKRSLLVVAVATVLGVPLVGTISAHGASTTSTAAAATGTSVVADWEMNEPAKATVAHDSGPNGLNAAVGNVIQTGQVDGARTFYHFPNTPPNTTPADTPRLVTDSSTLLNPGTRDFTISFTYRTTMNFGNIIQKGQHGSTGGYVKIEQPLGHLTCLFRGVLPNGQLNGVLVNSATTLDDGQWHSVTCTRTANDVSMTVDGKTTHKAGQSGNISNNVPLTIGGKTNCDQVTVTCDFFNGDIDRVEIDAGASPPPTASFVGAAGVQSTVKAPKATVPTAVQTGDLLLMESSYANATATAPAGWTQLGTADASGLASTVWWKIASASDAGSPVTVNLSVAARSTLELLAYSGVDQSTPIATSAKATNTTSTASHTTPTLSAGAGDWVVSLWSDLSSATTAWTAPSSVTTRSTPHGTGTGHVSTLSVDSGNAVTAGVYGGLTAKANSTGTKATMWTIALDMQ